MRDIINPVLLALSLGLTPGVAPADGDFRCGSRIITTGMTQSQVLDACGEPATKDVEDVDVRAELTQVPLAVALELHPAQHDRLRRRLRLHRLVVVVTVPPPCTSPRMRAPSAASRPCLSPACT